MEDIQSPNFRALSEFTRNIANDLAKHNRQVTMANVYLTYSWEGGFKATETQAYISLDNYPFAKLTLIEEEWLNADQFYVQFETGYNKFNFNEGTGTLIIESNQISKMGNYYVVEIKEV